jgi:ribokinase
MPSPSPYSDSAQKRVIVAGAVNIDHFYRVSSLESYRALPWWPRVGERALSMQQRLALDQFLTTSPDLQSTHVSGGGQAGNFAVALAECGVHVLLLTAVGNDAAARVALADLERVDLSLIHRYDATAEAFVFVDGSGERDILIYAPYEQLPPQANVVKGLSVDHVHFTSLPTEKQLELQHQISTLIPASAGRSLDIGTFYAAMGHRGLAHLLRGLDVLFATRREVELFAGLPLPSAANELFADGVKTICCKRGAAGASLYQSEGCMVESIAPEVSVVDTTGAGDVFAAVFIGACLNGASHRVALRVATRLASKSVTAWGRAAYPTNDEFGVALKEEQAIGELDR